jgi:rod shape-determining protein MreD
VKPGAVATIAARTALVLLTALLVQVSFVAQFSLDGARGDLLLLIALSAAVAEGPERGAVVGFAAGLTFDLVLSTPFGLSALVYCIVGFAVGSFQASVMRVTWWMPAASVFVGSFAAVLLYGIAGELLGQASLSGTPVLAIVAAVAVINGLLAPLTTKLMRWALADTSEPRFMPR